jgi:hypothetical protein
MNQSKENIGRWERKAYLVYQSTPWETKAIAAGRAMDNRLDFIAKGPYSQEAPSSVFDMQQWLSWFDWEVLVRRGLEHKAVL